MSWLSWGVIVLLSVSVGLAPEPLQNLGGVRNPFGLKEPPWVADAFYVALPLLPLCILASASSLVVRYRRSRGEQRQQIKWIAVAASFVGLFYLISIFIMVIYAFEPPSWSRILDSVAVLSYAGLPVAIGFAVLKYRLYDLDVIINRTLVYGALTASVVGIYVLVVGYLGALFQTGGNLFVSLLATGLVAVVFAPLRERLQRFVNRLMYGERDDPYAVVSLL